MNKGTQRGILTWTPRSPYLEPYNSSMSVKVDRLASLENVYSPRKSNPSLGKFEWKYNEINWFSISNQWNLISNVGCRRINDISPKTFPSLALVARSKCRHWIRAGNGKDYRLNIAILCDLQSKVMELLSRTNLSREIFLWFSKALFYGIAMHFLGLLRIRFYRWR